MAAAEIAERLMSMGFPLSGLDEWNTGDLIDWIAAHIRQMRIRNGENVPDPYEQYLTLKAMEPITKELAYSNTRLFQTDEDFYIGDINILPFKTPHDAAESVGFVFTVGEKKLTYMTDIGCMRESMLERAAGSGLVFIESNHDIEMLKSGPYPYPLKQRILSEHGHLSNENCGKALVKLYETGVRFAVLGHLSKENNTEYEAYNTVSRVLEEANIPDMRIVVAKRGEITGIFEL